MRGSARPATSMLAVSRTSWLVAPRWTYGAASGPTRSRRAATSGITGWKVDLAARPSASASYSPAAAWAATASAAVRGTMPSSA